MQGDVGAEAVVRSPPPLLAAALAVKVLSRTVAVPVLSSPPPDSAALSVKVQSRTVTVPSVGACAHHSAFELVISTPTRWPAGIFQSSP